MDRDFARLMMRHVDAIELSLGAMVEIVKEDGPEDLKQSMTSGLFKCVEELHLGVRRPICSVFPDLDNDKR